jgi:hypothetical protein
MKKNIFIAVLFSIVMLVSFSSCESDDDYLVRSGLYCDFLSTSNNKGYFASNGGGSYSFRDLPDLGYGDIIGMEYRGTTLTITGDIREGDVIRDLYISVQGVGDFLYASDIEVYKDYEKIVFNTSNDREFYNFMNDVMYKFYRDGRINIVVDGYITNYQGVGIGNVEMEIYLDSSLDVTVRR